MSRALDLLLSAFYVRPVNPASGTSAACDQACTHGCSTGAAYSRPVACRHWGMGAEKRSVRSSDRAGRLGICGVPCRSERLAATRLTWKGKRACALCQVDAGLASVQSPLPQCLMHGAQLDTTTVTASSEFQVEDRRGRRLSNAALDAAGAKSIAIIARAIGIAPSRRVRTYIACTLEYMSAYAESTRPRLT